MEVVGFDMRRWADEWGIGGGVGWGDIVRAVSDPQHKVPMDTI